MNEQDRIKAFEKLISRLYNENIDRKEFTFFLAGITAHIEYQWSLRNTAANIGKAIHEDYWKTIKGEQPELPEVLLNFDDPGIVLPPAEGEQKEKLVELVQASMFNKPVRPIKGLCVDVGCKGNPGKACYRGVDIETGKEVFYVDIPGLSTNNIGEFLAAVEGLQYVANRKSLDPDYHVYSDSVTAIAWVRQKKCKTKHVTGNSDQDNMIKGAEELLRHISPPKVHFWNNKLFGEIPADLSGRKGIKR